MAQFSFSFDVVEQWTGYFTADSEAEAEALLLEIIKNGDNHNELPSYDENNFDLNTSIELRSLRRVGD